MSSFGSRMEEMNWKPNELSLHELMNVKVMRLVINFDCNMKFHCGIGETVEEVALKNSYPLAVWQPSELKYTFEGVESWNQLIFFMCVSHHASDEKPWKNYKPIDWKLEVVHWHSQNTSCEYWTRGIFDIFRAIGCTIDWFQSQGKPMWSMPSMVQDYWF